MGGIGSVQTGTTLPPNDSTSMQTPSVAPRVSASGFSWLTATTRRAERRRLTTASGTTAAQGERSTVGESSSGAGSEAGTAAIVTDRAASDDGRGYDASDRR